MTQRERVKSALAHCEPDRVPTDLWGSSCRIHTGLYLKIANALGLNPLDDKLRPGTTTEYVDYRVSDAVQADFRQINIGRPAGFNSRQDTAGNTIDEWGIGRKISGGFNTIAHHPLAEATLSDLKTYAWPLPEDPGRIKGLADLARDWYVTTGYAITATSAVSGLFFELGQYLRGPEEFMVDLYDEPDFIHGLLDQLTELFIRFHLYYLRPIAPYLEWVEFTEDYGTQTGLFLSPALFRHFFKKPHVALFSAIRKEFPHLKIFFHSCGAIQDLIPDFIDMGVDILDPLQPLAKGMDLKFLKQEYGQDLIFHGGIDIQQAMTGSIEDVRREVEARIDVLAPGGGYILAPANHLQLDVPVENVITLYEHAHRYGRYKNG